MFKKPCLIKLGVKLQQDKIGEYFILFYYFRNLPCEILAITDLFVFDVVHSRHVAVLLIYYITDTTGTNYVAREQENQETNQIANFINHSEYTAIMKRELPK